MEITYGKDLLLGIATAKSCKEKKWKNVQVSWPKLVEKLSHTVKTYETMKEYLAMKKDDQDRIKDVGGFVGGELREGRRKNGYVKSRQVVTLDIDYGTPTLWDDIELLTDYALVAYSTHKHTPAKPRIRLIIPLDRPVSPEEYEAIARKLASEIGMDYFDDTTYEPTRLMFWPSTPKDIEFFYKFLDQPILSADKVLASYPDWKDVSYWPESSRVNKLRDKSKDKQGDPLSKEGLIGAFCRTYTIEAAINKFIPEEYQSAGPGRFTYSKGSTYGGLVVYDDKFAYSNHSTDPTGGTLCNAFDLVRIHKFHDLDEEAKEGTPTSKLPSWKAMVDLVRNDDEVKTTIAQERSKEMDEDFSSPLEENAPESKDMAPDDNDEEWVKDLSYNKQGMVESTLENILLILRHDKRLKGLGRLNTFSGRMELLNSKLPWSHDDYWSDTDSAGLRWYLETLYGIESRQKIDDAVRLVFEEKKYHPVREYLEKLEWDGTKRAETILIDYLGAEDTPYVREVTRKVLVAAVTRVYEPGYKFDYMLTIVGRQGIGKSYLWNKLGGAWFSDTLTDIKGKEAYEALDGVWIMEMGELSALKKQEREAIKQYLSKREDTYRKAFERYVTVNKRQCIFIGTTNDESFLNDATGNRRFWVVDTNEANRKLTVWDDLTDEVRDQIWAEVHELYKGKKESINALSREASEIALAKQEEHSLDSGLMGLIEEYLETPITKDWKDKTIPERVQYYNATREFKVEMTDASHIKRDTVCVMEIWVECLGRDKSDLKTASSVEIRNCIANIEGWSKVAEPTPRRCGPYGNQRVFKRL